MRQLQLFSRQELAGAFGDLGTDLPLLVGVILATGLDPTTTFVIFGGLQIASGLVYRLPMPVQPLKAMAAIAISSHIAPSLLGAGGLIVGVVMLLLAATGALGTLARIVPKPVVRGIQFGLGLQLATLALTRFLPSAGLPGYLLAAVALGLVITLRANQRIPVALLLLGLGGAFAFATWPDGLPSPVGWHLPTLRLQWPSKSDFAQAAVLLALPQIALSLGNSVLATRQVVTDLFPERAPLPVQKIGTTYALMNLVAAPLGGLPVCHGSGGVAGHYAFGARSGGSVVIYGTALILCGLLLVGDPAAFQRLVPGPILGTLLLVEAVTVAALIRDQAADRVALALAVTCGLIAVYAPYGYALALASGTLAWPLLVRSRAPDAAPAA